MSAQNTPRFTVREDGRNFVVHDGLDDSDWGMTMWRDEAQKLAARWNAFAAVDEEKAARLAAREGTT